ncbi:MAG: deoxyribose-phosphate aldolase [Candidatus Methanodesulfokora sp.]|nr:MAG: deoxyribose-phosphate aldolase [Candidatus Korarchaeota archaeon]
MRREELAKMIDHTLLKPQATEEDVKRLVDEAKQMGFYAVCVNPWYVGLASKLLRGSGIKVAGVVGFPLGSTFAEVKEKEAGYIAEMGADEADMVMNIGALRSGRYNDVVKEIRSVVKFNFEHVKVIIEVSLLSEEEVKAACDAIIDGGADFVKTSTGFLQRATTAEDIALLKRIAGDKLKIKAAGGIRSYDQALEMIKAGASRIGTSTGPEILKGAPD